MHLTSMILPTLLLFLVGIERGARREVHEPGGNTLWVIGGLAAIMAMQRGYYWSLFGREGNGPAGNKLTALVVFLGLIFLPECLDLINRLRKRGK